MRKELKLIIVFCGCLALSLFLLNWFIVYTVSRCPIGNIAKVNAVMNHQIDEPLTVWGASTARVHFDVAILNKELETTGFNLGLTGTFFAQYSGMLDEYLDYSVKGKVVVISVDVNGFTVMNSLYQGYSWLHHIQNPYIFDALQSVDHDLVVKSKYIPLYYFTTYDRRFLAHCLKWVYYAPDGPPELDTFGYHANQLTWNSVQRGKFEKPFSVNIDTNVVARMRKTIAHAKARQMEVVIVVPPCYAQSRDLLVNLKAFQDTLKTFETNNTRVYNYLFNALADDQKNFSDYNHLNEDGAKKFSVAFSKDLKEVLTSHQ